MPNRHGRVHVLLIGFLLLLPVLCASFLEAWNRRPSKEAAQGTGAVRKNAATRSTAAGSGMGEQALAGSASAPSATPSPAPAAAKQAEAGPAGPQAAVLENPPPSREREAEVLALGRVNTAGPELVALLKDPRQNRRIRHVAAVALARTGSPLAEDALLEASRSDPYWFSRWGITKGLAMVGGAEAHYELIAVLDRDWENDAVKGTAAQGLGEMPKNAPEAVRTRALSALEEALKDPGFMTRAYAAEALGKQGDAEAAGELRRLLREDPQDLVREQAARALGRLGAREAAGELAAVVSDPSRQAQAAWWGSLVALMQLSPAEATPYITPLMGSQDPLQKRDAVLALGQAGTPEAAALLMTLVDDETRVPGCSEEPEGHSIMEIVADQLAGIKTP